MVHPLCPDNLEWFFGVVDGIDLPRLPMAREAHRRESCRVETEHRNVVAGFEAAAANGCERERRGNHESLLLPPAEMLERLPRGAQVVIMTHDHAEDYAELEMEPLFAGEQLWAFLPRGHRLAGVPAISAHSSLLAEPVERLWRETTDRPLRLFGGYLDLTYGLSFYLPSHPLAVHVLEIAVPPATEARIAREGIALICPAWVNSCIAALTARVARGPAGKRIEIEISRRYLGIAGASARYVIATIPPRP